MTPGKRTVDLLGAGFGLVIVWPVLLGIALVILLVDGSPALFLQERVGYRGRPFILWKFRTMRSGTGGPILTAAGDPRITVVGRFLRRTKLDELPQLWNVLRGEMSLVGPRPEVRRYVELYTPAQRRVLELTPGITDPASLAYFDEERQLGECASPETAYLERLVREKIRLNVAYAERATIVSDIGLVLRTIWVAVRSSRPAAFLNRE